VRPLITPALEEALGKLSPAKAAAGRAASRSTWSAPSKCTRCEHGQRIVSIAKIAVPILLIGRGHRLVWLVTKYEGIKILTAGRLVTELSKRMRPKKTMTSKLVASAINNRGDSMERNGLFFQRMLAVLAIFLLASGAFAA